jgi:hypothetical protein
LGWYENRDFVFLAMEYIENGDLSQYLEKFGPKAKAEAKEIIGQLAEGLEVIHGQDICHRDLKPQVSISPLPFEAFHTHTELIAEHPYCCHFPNLG